MIKINNWVVIGMLFASSRVFKNIKTMDIDFSTLTKENLPHEIFDGFVGQLKSKLIQIYGLENLTLELVRNIVAQNIDGDCAEIKEFFMERAFIFNRLDQPKLIECMWTQICFYQAEVNAETASQLIRETFAAGNEASYKKQVQAWQKVRAIRRDPRRGLFNGSTGSRSGSQPYR